MRFRLFIMVAMLVSAPATAEVVIGSGVNCRDAPGGAVLTQLRRGEGVTISERSGQWARIRRTSGMRCWAAARYLGIAQSQGIHAVANGPKKATAPAKRKASRTRASRQTARPARHISPDLNCPCSSGRICIGPRGGRYCITSGGNKRYGV